MMSSTNTGTDAMIRTSQSVSTVSAWVEAWVGNQSMIRPRMTPRTEATRPIAISSLKWLRLSSPAMISSLPSDCMDAATYRSAGTEGTDAGGARLGRQARRAAGRAVVRGRHALRAPERLGELRRLAVADPVRDLAHRHAGAREQLGGAVHPHGRELLPERRPTDLGVGALELAARGGDSAGDQLERQLARVLALDDRRRVGEDARPELHRGRTLHS